MNKKIETFANALAILNPNLNVTTLDVEQPDVAVIEKPFNSKIGDVTIFNIDCTVTYNPPLEADYIAQLEKAAKIAGCHFGPREQ